jgi:hypothetical protein
MPEKGMWAVFIAVSFCCATLFASHSYAEHQAYKTGIYIGKAAFKTEDFKNRRCLGLHPDSSQRGCEVHDLNKDSVMEDALASASIIPALSDSTALHTGFRDGWREARTAGFANR